MASFRPFRFPAALAGLLAALPMAATALCTSEGVPQPTAVLERFTSADCAACWSDPATPKAAAGTFAIDWIVPGAQGENAPLSAASHEDALERLEFLRRKPPERSDAVTARRDGNLALRVAQGTAFNDYIGTSIELKDAGRAPWRPWLLLVESLPAGAEGSPVARNVVRNVFRPDWTRAAGRMRGKAADSRAMQIREGARAERLRLVAILHDGRGRVGAISHTECRE